MRVSLANTQERNLVVAQRARAHGICSTTRYLALPARTLSSIASLAALAQLYRRAQLPHVGREIEEAAAQLSDAPVSDWISDFDVEENGGRGWLTGLLCGYPVWTTAARYHTGGFESKK